MTDWQGSMQESLSASKDGFYTKKDALGGHMKNKFYDEITAMQIFNK